MKWQSCNFRRACLELAVNALHDLPQNMQAVDKPIASNGHQLGCVCWNDRLYTTYDLEASAHFVIQWCYVHDLMHSLLALLNKA